MTVAVRTAATAPHAGRPSHHTWVIERHPLGDEHEDHLGSATWRRPWSAYVAALRLGLVSVIERMKAIPAQPREVNVETPGFIGHALRLGLTAVFVLALARWRSWRRG